MFPVASVRIFDACGRLDADLRSLIVAGGSPIQISLKGADVGSNVSPIIIISLFVNSSVMFGYFAACIRAQMASWRAKNVSSEISSERTADSALIRNMQWSETDVSSGCFSTALIIAYGLALNSSVKISLEMSSGILTRITPFKIAVDRVYSGTSSEFDGGVVSVVS